MKTMTVPMPQRQALSVQTKRGPFWRRVKVLLRAVIFLGAVAVVAYSFPQSDYFKVQRVVFENAQNTEEKTILAASGIDANDNVLFLDIEAIEDNVEKLPYVKRCEVSRMSVNELLLRIAEREAAATVMVNNHLFEIDREFVVLRQISPFAVPVGPLITNLPGVVTLGPGQHLDLPELRAAFDLWEEFMKLPFSDKLTLSEISAESVDNIRMYFEELPYEMRWGRTDFETQTTRLAMLWDQMNGAIPCEYYLDLRFDSDLVCR